MSIQEISTWLGSSPILQGEKLNFSYLPSYSGWSLTIPKTETRADILGNRRELWQLKITRRYTIQSKRWKILSPGPKRIRRSWKAACPMSARRRHAGGQAFEERLSASRNSPAATTPASKTSQLQ